MSCRVTIGALTLKRLGPSNGNSNWIWSWMTSSFRWVRDQMSSIARPTRSGA